MSEFTRTPTRSIFSLRASMGLGALFLCLAASGALPAKALAADAADAADQAQPAQGGLEEITVTARRRAESLQTVPVAVSVMTGAQAAAQNLNNIQDMSAEIPSVDFRTGASNKDRDVFIRGIGTITTSPGVEPSVSTVVDGVVYDRPGQATAEMLDIDRVEVLRGPQGTLFGKNASAGVINIVTTDPTTETHGYADGSWYSGGNEYRFKGGVSGALIGNELLGSVSAVYSPYDDVKVTFNADWMHEWDTVPTGVPLSSSQVAYPTNVVTPNPGFAAALAASGVVPSPTNSNVSQDVNSNVRDENGGASITADWNIGGGYTLTSITAYRKWQNDQDQDYDQISQRTAAFPAVEDHGYLSFYQISEEARIASPKGHFIDYQAGVYYLQAVDTELYQRNVSQLGTATILPNNGVSNYGTTADNYSIFGESNLNFTDSF